MSSSPEPSTHTTGAHRAHGDARKRVTAPRGAHSRTLAQRPPARYEPYLDGLFTYCLSVLCDHDAATAALGDVLALAERRGRRGPASADDRRAWLYALARWSCLRKLTEARHRRQAANASGRRTPSKGHKGFRKGHKEAADQRAVEALSAPVSEEAQAQQRRELALLAWPEAAGTTPEQREALELAVRHQLAAAEVAAVLGLDLAKARELLATAACEVERTRAALAVVETGTCPSVARLTGDNQLVLSTTLRRELVRHVDDCPRCRRTAERAVPGTWPGTSVTPDALPVLEAPRAAVHIAMTHAPRARGPLHASTGAVFPWTPRTTPPAGTGSARVPSRPPSSPPSSPHPSSPSGRPIAARPSPARAPTAARSPRARCTVPTAAPARSRAATRTPATPAPGPTPVSPRAAARPTSPWRSSAPRAREAAPDSSRYGLRAAAPRRSSRSPRPGVHRSTGPPKRERPGSTSASRRERSPPAKRSRSRCTSIIFASRWAPGTRECRSHRRKRWSRSGVRNRGSLRPGQLRPRPDARPSHPVRPRPDPAPSDPTPTPSDPQPTPTDPPSPSDPGESTPPPSDSTAPGPSSSHS